MTNQQLYKTVDKPVLLEGAKYAYRSAQMHYEVAQNAIQLPGTFGLATSHVILAAEETIKSMILVAGFFSVPVSFNINPFFRDHRRKHKEAARISPDLLKLVSTFQLIQNVSRIATRAGLLSSLEAVSTLLIPEALLREFWNKANDQKNNGFYVDYSNNEWMVPQDTSVELFEFSKKVVEPLLKSNRFIERLKPGDWKLIDGTLLGYISPIHLPVNSKKGLVLNTPETWYSDYVQGGIDLLRPLIQGTEEQIKTCIEDYRSKKESHVMNEGTEIETLVDYHQGLDELTYDLRGVFEEHIPNLHRRSVLITLYSFLEQELERVCLMYQTRLGPFNKLEFRNEQGIEKFIMFLIEDVGLLLSKNDSQWKEIDNIRIVRNIFVHSDGKLGENVQHRSKVLKYIELKNDFLLGVNEIVIKKGYLEDVLSCFDHFFAYINSEIQKRITGKSH